MRKACRESDAWWEKMQRCLQAKVKNRNKPKHVMTKSEDLSRSLEIKPIWTFDTEIEKTSWKICVVRLPYPQYKQLIPIDSDVIGTRNAISRVYLKHL